MYIAKLFENFSGAEIGLLVLSLSLLLLSKQIFTRVFHRQYEESSIRFRVATLRIINLLIILVLLERNLHLPSDASPWPTKILAILLVIYAAYLVYHVSVYVIKRQFGKRREIEGEISLADTYNSRALNLLAGGLVFVAALISTIQILGFESLLEAGGLIGFIGVLLALTQGSWRQTSLAV